MFNYNVDNAPWNDYKDSITTLIIGDNITSLGDYDFADCSALSEVLLSTGVERIGERTFAGCSSIKELIIPDTLTDVGTFAFADLAKGAVIYNYSNADINTNHYVEGADITILNLRFQYADVNLDRLLTSQDAALLLQKTLNSSFKMKIERYAKNHIKYCDVTGDGISTAADAAEVLQKVLNNSYQFPVLQE